MCVCVCVCMRACMYVLCVCKYVCVYVCTYVCMCVCRYECMYVLCVCMHVCIMCVSMCVCVCVYVCIYKYIHTYVCTYVYVFKLHLKYKCIGPTWWNCFRSASCSPISLLSQEHFLPAFLPSSNPTILIVTRERTDNSMQQPARGRGIDSDANSKNDTCIPEVTLSWTRAYLVWLRGSR